MKKPVIVLILCLMFGAGCKKETKGTDNTNPQATAPSKMDLLCNEWILKETYVDDQPSTTNGTGKYRYLRDGQFQFLNTGNWETFASYKFNDQDSNSISVLFTGTSSWIWMDLKTMDKANLKTEFITGGKKLNYNYIR